MRVLIADDAVLVREGLASLLTAVGVDVVAQAGDADRAVALFDPELMDVAILDIRMPPTHTDEGVRAAVDIRRRHPRAGVMVLSQYVEVGFALRLISEHEAGTGYLLKERVTDIGAFVGALHHVAAGGSVLDAQLISLLAGDQLAKGRGASLTPASGWSWGWSPRDGPIGESPSTSGSASRRSRRTSVPSSGSSVSEAGSTPTDGCDRCSGISPKPVEARIRETPDAAPRPLANTSGGDG